jgi:spermidine synthase
MTRATGRRPAPTPADGVDGAHGRAELLRDADRRAAWMLLVDGVPQSHVDLDDPGYLDFEYVRRLGHVIDTAAPAAQPMRVLHLGAGALTLARYVTATRPGSTQLAVDVDAALVDLVRRRLPLRGVRVRIGDARAVLERLRADSFDVVIADVFAGGRTPAHLTSVEYMTAVRRVLRGGGVFAANVADGAPLAHARVQVATARAVFPQVALIADAAVLRGRRFGNLVLVASPEPLPTGALTRLTAADPMPGRVLYDQDLTRFAAGAKPVTDANAGPSPEPPADVFAMLAAALGARGWPTAAGAGLALGPDPHRDLDRAALEAELLAQPPLHEPPVGGLEEPRGEQDEVRRPDPSLGGEQDLGLPTAAHRRWGRGHQAGKPGVEPAGRDPGLPAG